MSNVSLLRQRRKQKRKQIRIDKHKGARYIPFNFEMILIRIERLLTDTYSTVAAVPCLLLSVSFFRFLQFLISFTVDSLLSCSFFLYFFFLFFSFFLVFSAVFKRYCFQHHLAFVFICLFRYADRVLESSRETDTMAIGHRKGNEENARSVVNVTTKQYRQIIMSSKCNKHSK